MLLKGPSVIIVHHALLEEIPPITCDIHRLCFEVTKIGAVSEPDKFPANLARLATSPLSGIMSGKMTKSCNHPLSIMSCKI